MPFGERGEFFFLGALSLSSPRANERERGLREREDRDRKLKIQERGVWRKKKRKLGKSFSFFRKEKKILSKTGGGDLKKKSQKTHTHKRSG